ncbi:MAG: hypothetical protein ACREHV_02275 [Rhizomicrobium sp.]
MDTLYYICSIVGIFVIIGWYIRNDGRSRTWGLPAMKEPDDPKAARKPHP